MGSRPSLARRVTSTTLADVGRGISNLIYRAAKGPLERRFARELSLLEKAYDQLGDTEWALGMNSTWVNQPKHNLEALSMLYETHPWVKICTSYIAVALSNIPFRITRAVGFEDGKEVREGAEDSDVGRMFRWINPHQSPASFMEHLASWLILTGEAYVVKTDREPSTPAGIPHELYVLFNPFVEKVSHPKLGIVGYNYNVGGEVVVFDASQVMYFQTWSPAGRFRGHGTPTSGYKTIQTDQELRDFNRSVLNQGVHLSGVLQTDNEDLGKEEADTVREAFMNQYAGSKNSSKIAVLWGGLQFSPQTILQKDVMMTEQQAAMRDEIIALFGLKPELLTEKFANKATAETVRRMAYEDTILGRWGNFIASEFSSTGLVQYDPDLRFEWDVSEVGALQTSEKERADTSAVLVGSGQLTLNEARERFHGLPPIDGAEGDVILVNGVPLGMTLAGPAPSEGQGEAPKILQSTALAQRLLPAVDPYSIVDRKAVHDELVLARTRRTAERRYEAALRKVYREIGQEARPILTASRVNYVESFSKMEDLWMNQGRKRILQVSREELTRAMNDAVEAELGRFISLGVEGVFDVKPVRALSRLGHQEQRIRNMHGKQWNSLRGSLSEGLASGESERELTGRVNKFFNGAKTNANTVARTEILPAVNGASMDVAIAAKEKGVEVVSTWITMEDEKVRGPQPKNHARAHGLTIVPGEELFLVSGQKLEFPGDSWNGATPDNTINCRCGVRHDPRPLEEGDNRGDKR